MSVLGLLGTSKKCKKVMFLVLLTKWLKTVLGGQEHREGHKAVKNCHFPQNGGLFLLKTVKKHGPTRLEVDLLIILDIPACE